MRSCTMFTDADSELVPILAAVMRKTSIVHNIIYDPKTATIGISDTTSEEDTAIVVKVAVLRGSLFGDNYYYNPAKAI